LHVHVHEGRLHVLHDDRRHAHVLRLLLLVASIDCSEVIFERAQHRTPHHRGFAVVVVRTFFGIPPLALWERGRG
jgi:hypothetical protein